MKKRTLMILGIIFAFVIISLLVISIYYKNNYHYSENAGEITKRELSCGSYYGDYNQKKIGTPENWVHALDDTRSAMWHAPENWKNPMDCEINNCSALPSENSDEIQNCCDTWVIENNITYFNPGWGGAWKIKNGTCVWSSNLPSEPSPLDFCLHPTGKSNKSEDELVQECCNDTATEEDVMSWHKFKCEPNWEFVLKRNYYKIKTKD